MLLLHLIVTHRAMIEYHTSLPLAIAAPVDNNLLMLLVLLLVLLFPLPLPLPLALPRPRPRSRPCPRPRQLPLSLPTSSQRRSREVREYYRFSELPRSQPSSDQPGLYAERSDQPMREATWRDCLDVGPPTRQHLGQPAPGRAATPIALSSYLILCVQASGRRRPRATPPRRRCPCRAGTPCPLVYIYIYIHIIIHINK